MPSIWTQLCQVTTFCAALTAFLIFPMRVITCARTTAIFPDDIRIERADHDANMYRFYRLRLLPDLFGGVSLIREWGRIGTKGRHKIELFEDVGKAANAMLNVLKTKQETWVSVRSLDSGETHLI